ncbi:MAG: gliding motility-associated C-terminal domain-containing protein, partial [Bacteroidota bacterium]
KVGRVYDNDLTPPFTFAWDSLAGNQNTPIATGLTAENYMVTVSDDGGCESMIEVTVGSTDNNFDVQAVAYDAVCFGDSSGALRAIASGGTGNYRYEWCFDNDTTVFSTQDSMVNVLPGFYVVIAYDSTGDGCEATRLVQVGEPDSLEAGFGTIAASDCGVPDGIAFARPRGGTAPFTYSWSTGETTDSIFNVPPGFYSLSVTDTFGCSDSKTVVISSTLGLEFEVEILQEDNCGLGEGIARVNITRGQAPYDIRWWVNRSDFSDTPFVYVHDLYATRSDSFTVLIQDSDSCLAFKEFVVGGNEPLEVTELSVENDYCDLSIGAVEISLTGGTEPYTYQWTTSPVQTNARAEGLIAGPYEVTIRDSFNCLIVVDTMVDDDPGFQLEIDARDESCYGREDGRATAITTGGVGGTYSYLWSTSPGQRERTARDLADGVYNVIVTDVEGCEREGIAEIGSEDFVQANFRAVPDTNQPVVLAANGFVFQNLSEGASNYIWDFGDGKVSDVSDPVHVYADTGEYFVTLLAYDDDIACADSAIIGPYIVTGNGQIFVPDAFTPNGDGFNDQLLVRGMLVQNYDLQIFSRWGRRVFQSSTMEDSWDGRLPNGKSAPEGVYVYTLTAVLSGDQPFEQTGMVVVIR